ncbi:sigma-70 family RNA polymerase sigma factor [Nocardia sp. CA-135953]|uniref:sigma-70 family RNA polymerase sigma factor n=1 Tax=Nocardia sp. CA-135953 TaxID=3239978 RepID=UPI003D97F735
MRDALGIPNETLVAALRRFHSRADTATEEAAEDRLFWDFIATKPDSPEEGEIRNKIIEKYMHVAENVARRWEIPNQQPDDLLQIACVAIMVGAARNFVPPGNFAALARDHAYYALARAYFEYRYPNIDQQTRQLVIKIDAYVNKREERGSSPNEAEISDALGVEPAKVTEALILSTQGPEALREPTDRESYAGQRDDAEQPAPSIDPTFAAEMREVLSNLPHAEEIVLLHFHEEMELTEVCEQLGITLETAQRVITQAAQALRARFAEADQAGGETVGGSGAGGTDGNATPGPKTQFYNDIDPAVDHGFIDRRKADAPWVLNNFGPVNPGPQKPKNAPSTGTAPETAPVEQEHPAYTFGSSVAEPADAPSPLPRPTAPADGSATGVQQTESTPPAPARTLYDGAEMSFRPELDDFWREPVEAIVLDQDDDGRFLGPDEQPYNTVGSDPFLLHRNGKIVTARYREHPNLHNAYLAQHADENERRENARHHGPSMWAGFGLCRMVEGIPEFVIAFSGLFKDDMQKTPKFWVQLRHRLSQNFDLSTIFFEFGHHNLGGAWWDHPENNGECSAAALVPEPGLSRDRFAVSKRVAEHLRGGGDDFWFEVEHVGFPYGGGLSINMIIHPVLGDPARLTANISPASTTATAEYQDFDPGPEPERTYPAFRTVHDVLTRWLSASGFAWAEGTEAILIPAPAAVRTPRDSASRQTAEPASGQAAQPAEDPDANSQSDVAPRLSDRAADPATMTFEEFRDEYHCVMTAVAAKEKNPGQPLTEEERLLSEQDWRAFSRSRGYSEADIAEYERWLELSGQKQGLPGAVNDPWRRTHTITFPGGWESALYVRHVEARMAQDGAEPIPPEVLESYRTCKAVADQSLIAPWGGDKQTSEMEAPLPTTPDTADDWLWVDDESTAQSGTTDPAPPAATPQTPASPDSAVIEDDESDSATGNSGESHPAQTVSVSEDRPTAVPPAPAGSVPTVVEALDLPPQRARDAAGAPNPVQHRMGVPWHGFANAPGVDNKARANPEGAPPNPTVTLPTMPLAAGGGGGNGGGSGSSGTGTGVTGPIDVVGTIAGEFGGDRATEDVEDLLPGERAHAETTDRELRTAAHESDSGQSDDTAAGASSQQAGSDTTQLPASAATDSSTTDVSDYVLKCLPQAAHAAWAVGYDGANLPAADAETWPELQASLPGSFTKVLLPPKTTSNTGTYPLTYLLDALENPKNKIKAMVLVVDDGSAAHVLFAVCVGNSETLIFDTDVPQPSTTTRFDTTSDEEHRALQIPRVRTRDQWKPLFTDIKDAFVLNLAEDAAGLLHPITPPHIDGPTEEQQQYLIHGRPGNNAEGPDESAESDPQGNPAPDTDGTAASSNSSFLQWIRGKKRPKTTGGSAPSSAENQPAAQQQPTNSASDEPASTRELLVVNKPFAHLILGTIYLPGGQVGNRIGSIAATSALPYALMHAGQSPKLAATAGALAWGTRLLDLHAGIVTDRRDRKKVMVYAQSIGAGAAATATGLILFDAPHLGLGLTAASVLEGIAATYYFRTYLAVVGDILTKGQAPLGNDFKNTAGSIADITGQALGPGLFGIAPAAPFGLNALSYLTNLPNLWKLPFPTQIFNKPGSFLRDLGEGARVLWRDTFLREFTGIGTLNNAAWAMMGFRTTTVLEASDLPGWAVGAVVAAPAVGGMLGGILRKLTRKVEASTFYPVALANMAGFFALQAATTNPAVIAAASLLDTMVMTAMNSRVGAYETVAIPSEIRGRVGGVKGTFLGSGPSVGLWVSSALVGSSAATTHSGDVLAALAATITAITAAGYTALLLVRKGRVFVRIVTRGRGLFGGLSYKPFPLTAPAQAHTQKPAGTGPTEQATPNTPNPTVIQNCAIQISRVHRAIGDDTGPDPNDKDPRWDAEDNWRMIEKTLGAQLRPMKTKGTDPVAKAVEIIRDKSNDIDRVAVTVDEHIHYVVDVEGEILVFDTLIDDPDNDTLHVRNVKGDNKWQPSYSTFENSFYAAFTHREGTTASGRRQLPGPLHIKHPPKLQGRPDTPRDPADPHESAPSTSDNGTGQGQDTPDIDQHTTEVQGRSTENDRHTDANARTAPDAADHTPAESSIADTSESDSSTTSSGKSIALDGTSSAAPTDDESRARGGGGSPSPGPQTQFTYDVDDDAVDHGFFKRRKIEAGFVLNNFGPVQPGPRKLNPKNPNQASDSDPGQSTNEAAPQGTQPNPHAGGGEGNGGGSGSSGLGGPVADIHALAEMHTSDGGIPSSGDLPSEQSETNTTSTEPSTVADQQNSKPGGAAAAESAGSAATDSSETTAASEQPILDATVDSPSKHGDTDAAPSAVSPWSGGEPACRVPATPWNKRQKTPHPTEAHAPEPAALPTDPEHALSRAGESGSSHAENEADTNIPERWLAERARDRERIAAIQSGDVAAFDELYRNYWGLATSVAAEILSDPTHVEDVVGDCFVALFAAIRRGGGPTGSVGAYLAVSVRRAATAFRNRPDQPLLIGGFQHWVDQSAGNPGSELSGDSAINLAFKALPENLRTVLWLTAVDGRTREQAAEQLGSTPDEVGRLAALARRMVRAIVAGQPTPTPTTRAADSEWPALGLLSNPTNQPIKEPSGDPTLSEQEKLLRLLATGMTYPQIAAELGISLGALQARQAKIAREFGTGERAEILAAARIRGLLTDELGSTAPEQEAPPDPQVASSAGSADPVVTPAQLNSVAIEKLSRREAQVVGLAACGLSTRAIGLRLKIAPHTAEDHLGRAAKKLGTKGRDATIAAATRPENPSEDDESSSTTAHHDPDNSAEVAADQTDTTPTPDPAGAWADAAETPSTTVDPADQANSQPVTENSRATPNPPVPQNDHANASTVDTDMIRQVLPAEVHTAETLDNEHSSVFNVWRCTERLLGDLGLADEPIPMGSDGRPQWPLGLIGATAQTNGYSGVALAPGQTFRAIGLDAKNAAVRHARIHNMTLPHERSRMRELNSQHATTRWDQVYVSAKDNALALHSRLTGRLLNHSQVEVTLRLDDADNTTGTFEARLPIDAPEVVGPSLATMSGGFCIRNGIVVTAIALRHEGEDTDRQQLTEDFGGSAAPADSRREPAAPTLRPSSGPATAGASASRPTSSWEPAESPTS